MGRPPTNKADFDRLFYPRSVAVIGASDDRRRLGHHCMKSITSSGFGGRVYPIHPSLPRLFGLDAYPSVKDVPGEIDMAIVVVRAALVPAVLEECAQRGIKGVVMITAGFKESDDEAGARLQDEVAEIANRSGIKIIGPNTFGMVNLYANLNASFTPEFSLMPRGRIGLVSQSGGFCHLVGPLSIEEDIGFSKLMSLGNRCNIEFADMLGYMAEDSDTDVILMYIEGVDNPRRLVETAAKVSPRKPIVALKAGRARVSDKAAYSHTGSLAGRYELYSAALRQAGVLVVETTTELLDVAQALELCPLPRGNRAAVISAQAGLGMIASDICETEGLVMATLAAETRRQVDGLLPPLSIRSNPIDMGPIWTDWESCRKLAEIVLADDGVDGLVLLSAYASANEPTVREIATWQSRGRYPKPLITCFPAPAPIWVKDKRELKRGGIPVYLTPERAAKALSALFRRRQLLDNLGG